MNQALSISVFGITFVIYGTYLLIEFRSFCGFLAGGIADEAFKYGKTAVAGRLVRCFSTLILSCLFTGRDVWANLEL